MDWKYFNSSISTLCLVLTVLSVVVGNVSSQMSRSSEQAILDRIFEGGRYDARIRPINGYNKSEPVRVQVNIFLRQIQELNDSENEFKVQITFRQKWRDERLSFSTGVKNFSRSGVQHVSLINPQNQIWRPDTFFSNEKEGNYHDLLTRNEFARVYPNGEVLHSVRLSLRLLCPMSFNKFPLDTQVCGLRLASYGYTSNEVRYEWEKGEPVQTASDLTLPRFSLEGDPETNDCTSETTTGSYSCLRADFTLKREISFYLVQVYIPTTMMTIVSWLSFWISGSALAARTVLTSLTLFVLAILTAEANKMFPPTSYTKAIDVWTGICLTFVFAALCEFIIVQYIIRRNEGKPQKPKAAATVPPVEQEIPLKDLASGTGPEGNQGAGPARPKLTQRMQNATRKYLSRFVTLPDKIDAASRVIFPVLFIIFNIIYWPVAAA